MLYASSLIGAILVPINYRLTPQEIAFIAEDAGLHVLCADQAAATVLEQGLEGLGCAHFLGVDFENAVWQSMQNLHRSIPTLMPVLQRPVMQSVWWYRRTISP